MEHEKAENTNNTENKKPTFFRKYVLQNLGIKIAAVLFAMIIWGVVLTTQNPSRSKTIQDVPVNFSNEYELHSRELVVRGKPLQEHGAISVRVNTPITNYRDFTKDNLNATVNLNNIAAPGAYSLPINVSTVRSSGSVVDTYTPDKLDVEIDTLMTKSVPVEAVYEGSLPEGYYADVSNEWLSESSIEISGPRQDARQVTKAVCRIQLNGRVKSYKDALELYLLDENGNEIDSSLFIGVLPTVTVTLPIYARKTVPIDVERSLLGADNLAPNYELVAATAIPETLDIIGDEAVLAGIDYITVEGIDVTGRKESLHDRRAINEPEGIVKILNSNLNLDEIEVFVDIREIQTERVFTDVPIQFRELGRGLRATLSEETTNISVQGRISLVEFLERNEIEAYVDLKDLKEGKYELMVSAYLGDEETTLELSYILSVAKVTVTIE